MSLDKLEVVEGEITSTVRVTFFVHPFGFPELVVGADKQGQYRFHCFQTSEKAATLSPQSRYVVPKVGVGAFDDVRVPFVANVAPVTTDKVHTKITLPAVCEIRIRLRGLVHVEWALF
jgi:hypothetical protein